MTHYLIDELQALLPLAEDVGRHADWDCLAPGMVVTADARCSGCAKLGTAGHETCSKVDVTTPPTGKKRIHLSYLRALQWLVHRLGMDATGVIGSQTGFLINASASYNYADAVTWEIAAGSGQELTLEVPGGGDPRKVLLYQFRTIEPDIGISYVTGGSAWGVVQPGDRVEFVHPSCLYGKTWCTVVQILSCTATQLRVRVDADVTNWDYSCDTAQPDPSAFYCKTWREAGDPEKWLDKPSRQPDPQGIRCQNCRRDYTQSIGNYGAPDGVVINAAGEHWYCKKRRYAVGTEVDTDDDTFVDTWSYDWYSPTKITTFPANGYCAQTDCDQYEAPARGSDWLTQEHGGQFFQDLWSAVDTCLEQGIPGYSGFRNYTLYRVKHPSLMSLTAPVGFYATAAGQHPQRAFWRQGGYGRYETEVDGDDTTVKFISGGDWEWQDSWAGVELLDDLTWPPDGLYPREVTGFTTHHDQVDYTEDLDDTTDPSEDRRKHIERMGLGITMDAGTWAGRGVARWSHLQEVGDPVVLPDTAPTAAGTTATRIGKLVVPASPVTVEGVSCGGYLEIWPLQDTVPTDEALDYKVEQEKWTREVESVTSLGDGLYELELKNDTHLAGFVAGDPGSRYDRIYEWKAGGGQGFHAPYWAEVRNYYAVDKTVGSALRGVFQGDTVSFDLTVGTQDLNDRRFLVVEAEAHDGSAAANWGDEKEIRRFDLGGCFTADDANTVVVTDPDLGELHGPIYLPRMVSQNARSDSDTDMGLTTQASMTAGLFLRNERTDEIVEVGTVQYLGSAMTVGITRGAAGTTPAAILAGDTWEWQVAVDASTDVPLTRRYEVERPTDLTTGECWVDPSSARVFFCGDDAAQDLVIWYAVEGQDVEEAGCYSEAYTIEAWAEFLTDLDWTTYGGMTPRVLELLPDGDALTYGAGNPSDETQYTLYEGTGSVVAVRCVLGLAARTVELEITTGSVLTAPPAAVALCADYLSYGKLMDRVVVRDDSGMLGTAGAGLEDIECTFWWSAGLGVGAGAVTVEWTEYESDAWATLDAADTVVDGAAGRVWIEATALAAMPTRTCWRVSTT